MKALTTKERKRFEDLVEEGRNCYSAMALILKEIREGRLYREAYESFKDFAKSEFNIGESRAYQLIEHVEISEEMEKQTSTIVEGSTPAYQLNEGQTRELGKVDSGQRGDVLEAAIAESKETGKPLTAKLIKKFAKSMAVAVEPDPDESQGESQDTETDDSGETGIPALNEGADPDPGDQESIVRDSIEREVPAHLQDAHGMSAALITAGNTLNKLIREVDTLSDNPGGEHLQTAMITSKAKELKGLIQDARYYTVCPKCLATTGSKCGDCRGIGFIPHRDRGILSDADKRRLGI